MLEFMKIYSDMEQLFEPFTDEECGRLFRAMMEYAFNGVEPQFTGNERYIWAVLRRHFDQCAAVNEKNATNGSKGGRPRNQSKPKETEKNPEKPKETQINREEPKETLQEQEHIQEQEQEHIQEQKKYIRAHVREETPNNYDEGIVLGIDGSDLREDIERNQIADGLILRYRLGRDDVTREALIADLAEYGEAKMREVLNTAASSNKYDKISVKFWRAILNNNGSRASPKDTGILPGQVYRSRQYTPDDYKSIEVNLDELDSHGRLPGEAGYGT